MHHRGEAHLPRYTYRYFFARGLTGILYLVTILFFLAAIPWHWKNPSDSETIGEACATLMALRTRHSCILLLCTIQENPTMISSTVYSGGYLHNVLKPTEALDPTLPAGCFERRISALIELGQLLERFIWTAVDPVGTEWPLFDSSTPWFFSLLSRNSWTVNKLRQNRPTHPFCRYLKAEAFAPDTEVPEET